MRVRIEGIMARSWTRDQQRRRKKKIAAVVDRLLGKKKPKYFFGGTEMRMPIQYGKTNAKMQAVIHQVKQLAMKSDIKVLWAQEPGEAARKRREEEERNASQLAKR